MNNFKKILQNIIKNKVFYIVFFMLILINILELWLSSVNNEIIKLRISAIPEIWINIWITLISALFIASLILSFYIIIYLPKYTSKTGKKDKKIKQLLNKLLDLLAIPVSLSLFFVLLGLLYLLGFSNFIFDLFKFTLFPMFTDTFNLILTFIVNILIPGLLTNLVYDFIKKKMKLFSNDLDD